MARTSWPATGGHVLALVFLGALGCTYDYEAALADPGGSGGSGERASSGSAVPSGSGGSGGMGGGGGAQGGAPPLPPCPEGWEAIGSFGCFKAFATPSTWQAAFEACQEVVHGTRRGRLVTMAGEKKRAALLERDFAGWNWVGAKTATNPPQKDAFLWVSTGQKFYAVPPGWRDGHPQERCVALRRGPHAWITRACNDATQKQPYVCEIPP